MRVVLKNKEEFTVSEEQAKKVKDSIAKDRSGMVIVNSQMIDKSYIIAVLNGGTSSKTPAKDGAFELDSGPACTGKKSIQTRIHQLAIEQGDSWSKLVQDKVWREKTRKFLWLTDKKWCDYVAKTCACNEM